MSGLGDDLTLAAEADSATLVGDSGDSDGQPWPRPRDQVLIRGQSIGRYVVIEKLGAGGMGIVYAAYDPELDRKVALKLLLAAATGTAASSEGHARLIREAQAMARLSHPNVVAIHDVGEHEGRVFLAMEYVEGQTAAAWLRARERPWLEVIQMFRAAGRGLEAAHEAGLVHRDFKPDNVMIDRQGRVKVMDFGLARAGASAQRASLGASLDLGSEQSLASGASEGALTREGAIVGTPAYMAPEQYEGAETGPRTDQYAFCVALYEGLYGVRPYTGRSLAALAAAICEATPPEAPRGSPVPAWLRRVVLRGLSADPEQRWPSMHALLDQLEHDPTLARRRWLSAGLALALTAVVAYASYDSAADDDGLDQVCAGADEHLDGVWDAELRAGVEAAMLATGRSYARDSFMRVASELDAYALAWQRMRTAACEATRVTQDQSEAVMDLRMACLDDRLGALRATTRVLESADPELVAKAIRMVDGLPSLARCADVGALMAERPPPEDPAVAAEVAAIEAQLAEARALEMAGRYRAALDVATQAHERAVQTEHPPTLAQALARQGQLRARLDEPEAEADLRRALALAIEHDMVEVATDVTYYLTYMFGQLRGDRDQAMQWGPLALAYARASDSAKDEAQALASLGGAAYAAGEFDDARRDYEAALALVERSRPDDDYLRATMMDNLGTALTKLGELDAARHQHERALGLFEARLGPGHPRLATTYNNLGALARATGQSDRARDYHERALLIFEDSMGKDHRMVAGMVHNIAEIARDQGDLDAAIAKHRRAIELMVAALGDDHLHTAFPRMGLGLDLLDAERPADAIEPLERALALREAHGANPGALASTRFALARALWDADADAGRERDRARELAELALAAYADKPGSADKHGRVAAWLAAR